MRSMHVSETGKKDLLSALSARTAIFHASQEGGENAAVGEAEYQLFLSPIVNCSAISIFDNSRQLSVLIFFARRRTSGLSGNTTRDERLLSALMSAPDSSSAEMMRCCSSRKRSMIAFSAVTNSAKAAMHGLQSCTLVGFACTNTSGGVQLQMQHE